MPFYLVPKEQEPTLRAKKDNFKLVGDLFGTRIEINPDNWTEGVAVVVIDAETEEVVAYWSSSKFGGCWNFLEDDRCIAPYLFKRPKAAFRRMEKAGDIVNLQPHGKPRREARLAVWRAGHDPALMKYTARGFRFPGSPRK